MLGTKNATDIRPEWFTGVQCPPLREPGGGGDAAIGRIRVCFVEQIHSYSAHSPSSRLARHELAAAMEEDYHASRDAHE